MGGQMRTLFAGLALLVGLVACENRGAGARDTGRVDDADTTVMTRTTQDTMIVKSDTQVDVDVDTTVREGGVVGRDTAR